jgi:hypothetical protein
MPADYARRLSVIFAHALPLLSTAPQKTRFIAAQLML